MKFDFQNLCLIILYAKIVFFSAIFVQYKCCGSHLCVRFHGKIMPDSVSTKWHMIIGTSNFFITEIFVHSYNPIFICGANQEVPVPACLPACPSQILSSGTKFYSPNLCLGFCLFVCLSCGPDLLLAMLWSGLFVSFSFRGLESPFIS